jgi:hypothetical protein
MTFFEQMQDSFRGERLEAFFFIAPAGVILFVVAGAALKSQGNAFGIVLIGVLGFLINGFADRRSRPYTAALEALATQHGVPLDGR